MASTVPVCGIDLGTTTSAACIYVPATATKPSHTDVIRLGRSGDTIPSVVCLASSGIWKAGYNAITEANKDRANTPLVTRSKRLIGLQYEDFRNTQHLEQMPLVKEGKADGDYEGRPVFALGETACYLMMGW